MRSIFIVFFFNSFILKFNIVALKLCTSLIMGVQFKDLTNEIRSFIRMKKVGALASYTLWNKRVLGITVKLVWLLECYEIQLQSTQLCFIGKYLKNTKIKSETFFLQFYQNDLYVAKSIIRKKNTIIIIMIITCGSVYLKLKLILNTNFVQILTLTILTTRGLNISFPTCHSSPVNELTQCLLTNNNY